MQRTFVRSLLLAGLALLTTFPLAAAEWMVPAAAHAPGAAGTNWRTDLRIVNPSGNAASVRLDLLPQNGDNAARSQNVTINVPAQGQLSLNDVLASQFSFTGNAALMATSSETSLVVTSRTYNEASNGSTYGQFIPGVPTAKALTPGAQGHLIYLSKTDAFRSNLGFAGTTAQRGAVTVTLHDAAGMQIGQGVFQMQPYGQLQVNDVFAATGAPAMPVARAVVTTTVPIVAYASIIDNRTGDPVAMIAAKDSEATTELAIPAVAHSAGAAGSSWRSDVRVFHLSEGNDNHGATVLTVSYYPANTPNAPPATRTITIGANEVLSLDDILLRTFGLDNATGALRIRSEGGRILATSRTYNQSSTGTFGQDIPAVALSAGLPGNATAVFSGLSDSGYRTNVGFFNLSSTALDLTLTLKRPDGSVISTKPFRLEGNVMTQLNLFSFMDAAGTQVASLAISANGSATTPYWAYASVIDNASGDPVFVPAALSTAAPVNNNPNPGSGTCVTIPHMRAGMKLGYRSTDGQYVSQQTVLADGPTQTMIRDETVAGGAASTIETTVNFQIQNDLRAISSAVTKASVSAGGFSLVITSNITYSPALVSGPVSNFCQGAKFPVGASTQTITVTGAGPGSTTINQLQSFTGEVIAVNESLTTAAGTFNTVKYKSGQGVNGTTAYSMVWYDIATGALVKQEQYNANGSIGTVLELTSIQ